MAPLITFGILLCFAGPSIANFYQYQPFIDPICHSNCSWKYYNREDGEDGTRDFVLRTQNCTTLDYTDDGSLDVCPIPTSNAKEVGDRASPVKDVTMEEFTKTFSALETGDEDTAGSYTCLRMSYKVDPAVAEKLQAIQFVLAGESTLEGNMQFCQNHDHGDGTEYYAVQELNEQDEYADRVFTYECFCGIRPGLAYRFDIRALPVDFSDPPYYYDTVQRLKYPEQSKDPHSSCTTKPDDKRCDLNDAAKWYPACFHANQILSEDDDYSTIEASFTIAPSELEFDRYKIIIQRGGEILDSFINRMDWVEPANCSGTLQQVSKMNVSELADDGTFTPSCDYLLGVQAFPMDKCQDKGGAIVGCPVSWTDTFCVIANPCDDSPCTVNGKCDPDKDTYNCICNDGYMFNNGTCQVDACFNNPCNDTAGVCNRKSDGGLHDYYCTCNIGFTLSIDGKTCMVDPCYTKPCGNGTCHLVADNMDSVWGFICICDKGFTNSSTTCEEIKNDNLITILAAVLGASMGVLLILVAIYFVTRKPQPKDPIGIRIGPTSTHVINLDEVANQQPPPSSFPRVFIMYSEDHDYHKKAVLMLATFLQEFCHCKVRLDMWFSTEIGYKRDWLISEILNADKVLMIFSKGTLLKWKAAVMKQPTDTSTSGEFGDMFLPGYRYALSEIEDNPELLSSKYIAALFEYSKKEHVLPDVGNVFKYHIPQNLEDLFFRLHDISKYSPKSSRKAHGCLPDDLRGSPEGKALYTAIEQMKTLVKDNPEWYDNQNRLADDGYVSQSQAISTLEQPNTNLDIFFKQISSKVKDGDDDDGGSSDSNFSKNYHALTEESYDYIDDQYDIEGLGYDPGTFLNPNPQRISNLTSLSQEFEEPAEIGTRDFFEDSTNDHHHETYYQYDDPQRLHTLDSQDVQIHVPHNPQSIDTTNYMTDYHIAK